MSKRSMQLKKRWRQGEMTYGAWLAIGNTSTAEIMAGVGFDWVIVDLEHTAIGYDQLQQILVAFASSPTVPLVRVPWNDPIIVKRVLDIGADGILFPMIKTPEEARAAVAACKYPPVGRRGFGPWRASDWFRKTHDYTHNANESLIVITQIEHISTIPMIDELAAVPGIDALCMGPSDLSGSIGRLEDIHHPRVTAAIEAVCKAAGKQNLPVCLGMPFPDKLAKTWCKKGVRLVVVTADVEALRDGAAERLARVRTSWVAKAGAARNGAKARGAKAKVRKAYA